MGNNNQIAIKKEWTIEHTLDQVGTRLSSGHLPEDKRNNVKEFLLRNNDWQTFRICIYERKSVSTGDVSIMLKIDDKYKKCIYNLQIG